MRAPAGAEVGLTYDTCVSVEVGDALVTGTGRAYLITAARLVHSRAEDPATDPAGRRRWALRAVVVASEELPPHTLRHYLQWDIRGRRM